jgi:hypothetical protein
MSDDAIVPAPGDPASHSDNTPAVPCQPPPSKILNLFLHGLFVVIDRPDHLDVLLPAMPDHSFRFGEFLGETQLKPKPFCNPYVLTGVTGGCTKFDLTKNLSLKGMEPDPAPLASNLHCRIVLPTPIDIYTMRPFDLRPLLSDPTPFQNTVVSTLHVLTYAYEDSTKVKVSDHIFTESQQNRNGKTYMSLHMFSEEDFFPLTISHSVQGFDAMVRLFPNLRVFLTGDTDNLPNITEADIAPGTILPEYEDLRFRTADRLAIIGRQMRSGTFPKFWGDGGSPEGSSIRTCTNILSQVP